MSSSPPQPDPDKRDAEKLDAYLDGQLPADEHEAVARALAANPEAQHEIELQAQIDASLQKSFAPRAIPGELLAKLREVSKVVASPRAKPRNWKTIAALASAAAVVWGVLAWRFFGGGADLPDYNPRKPLESIYAATVAEGFKPEWVCKDDAQFISTFKTRQGQGLLLAAADMPAGTKMEGLTYVGGISRYTTTMLARVDNKPVMVFVDRANSGYRPPEPCGSSQLHLFSKQIGSLMLYELTPLDEPKLLEYFKLAE